MGCGRSIDGIVVVRGMGEITVRVAGFDEAGFHHFYINECLQDQEVGFPNAHHGSGGRGACWSGGICDAG